MIQGPVNQPPTGNGYAFIGPTSCRLAIIIGGDGALWQLGGQPSARRGSPYVTTDTLDQHGPAGQTGDGKGQWRKKRWSRDRTSTTESTARHWLGVAFASVRTLRYSASASMHHVEVVLLCSALLVHRSSGVRNVFFVSSSSCLLEIFPCLMPSQMSRGRALIHPRHPLVFCPQIID